MFLLFLCFLLFIFSFVLWYVACFFFFFFFQAEDGIRDGRVTGVQTCALPIFGLLGRQLRQRVLRNPERRTRLAQRAAQLRGLGHREPAVVGHDQRVRVPRSEERRVGKECRSRGWAYH